jgi:hypothetical protein
MAGSIQLNFSVQATNGTFKEQWLPDSQTIVQNITTAPFEAIASGIATTGGTAVTIPVTTLGLCVIQNTDATNYFTVNGFLKVKPSEQFVMRLVTGITVTITANTASTGYVLRCLND